MAYLSDFQSALYKLLDDNLTIPVYDDTPKDSIMPYVTIEDLGAVPIIDKNSEGFETVVNIGIWSDYKGNKEVNDTIVSIFDILSENDILMDGYKQVLREIQVGEVVKETDGLTRSGSLAIRYILYKTQEV